MSADLLAKRAALETSLREALLAGARTAKLRAQIEAIEREIAAADLAQAEAEAVATALVADRIEAAAAATAEAIEQRRTLILSDIDVPGEITVTDDSQIVPAARDLDLCTFELAEANKLYAIEQEIADKITGRSVALADARANIIARRQGGDLQPGDAGELALIQADIEGLAPLAAEATDNLASARKAMVERAAARQRAMVALGYAEDTALCQALTERAEQLDTALFDVIGKLGALHKRLAMRPSWIASAELLQALRQLAASRPDLAEANQPGSRFRRTA